MAYSIEQYNALQDAIAQGVLEVHYADKTVKYRSLDDMLRIVALMRTELFPSRNNSARRYVSFNKGTVPRCRRYYRS